MFKNLKCRRTFVITGAAVKLAEDRGIQISQLSLNDLRSLHYIFEEDVMQIWNYENSVESRNSDGGTAKAKVLEQIELVHEK